MLSSSSTYCRKIFRRLLVPVLAGLLVFGWVSAQGAQTYGDTGQSHLSFATVDNFDLSSSAIASGDQVPAKISPENLFGDVRGLFLWGLTNDTMSEDDRLYPQLFSHCSACQRPANPSYQSGWISSHFDNFEDLSLKIIATVVFLN